MDAERGHRFDYQSVFQSSGSHRVAREASVQHANQLEQFRVEVVEKAGREVLERKAASIAELAAKVKTFRAHLRQEETLSKAVGLH